MKEMSSIIVQVVVLRAFPGTSKGKESPEGVQQTTRLGETDLSFPGEEGSRGFQDRVLEEGGCTGTELCKPIKDFLQSLHVWEEID